jgi:CheY-like chemotaxis protein
MSKPVIMTVDDEPEVLNAVERDLRKRYGAEYRIVKATSGAQALEATRQLKQRNAPLALFLVDARMPQMSGSSTPTPARCCSPRTPTPTWRSRASTRSSSTTTS